VNVIRPEPVDALARAPMTDDLVWLNGQPYDRGPLETAWLALAEAGGDRAKAADAMWQSGASSEACIVFIRAAEGWTGNVVAGEVR